MSGKVDPREFRDALGAFATGVTIVTTRDGQGQDVGLTANSFNSVSLEPPMVLWSLAKSSSSLPAFADASDFAVHILAADQEDLSNRFARKGADKFAGIEPRRNAAGIPMLDGCTALFQCRTAYRYEGGDHVIFVGEVLAFEHLEKPPLLFHGGRYATARTRQASSNPLLEGELDETSLGNLITRAFMQLVTPLRRSAERMGLDAPSRYMLNLLLADAGHDLATMSALVSHTGVQLTPGVADSLVERGFVTRETPAGGGERFALTPEGRRVTVELLAAAKAREADATSEFSEDEQRVLRDLLSRLVAGLQTRGDERMTRHLELIRSAVDGAAQDDRSVPTAHSIVAGEAE